MQIPQKLVWYDEMTVHFDQDSVGVVIGPKIDFTGQVQVRYRSGTGQVGKILL